MSERHVIPEPVIELRSVVCLIGRFPALAGVDLSVGPGEVVLVQGPNGAGKTSVLRACAGLMPIASGEATVLGCDLIEDRRRVRSMVGMLGHATGLYDDLTVADNVGFWAEASRAPEGDAASAMERVGLATRLWSLPVNRLSAGQRRRASLAAMIVRRPSLWLLDEPHAGLDAEGRDLVDGLVAEASAVGATVVFASHDLDRAGQIAARVVTLEGGAVTADSRRPVVTDAP